MEKPVLCPFCGNALVSSRRSPWQAFCLVCKAEGPESETWEGALAAWNKRAEPVPAPSTASLGQQIADAACVWSLAGDTNGWGSEAAAAAFDALLCLCDNADEAEAALVAARQKRTRQEEAKRTNVAFKGNKICHWVAGHEVFFAGCSGKPYGAGYWVCPDCGGNVRVV